MASSGGTLTLKNTIVANSPSGNDCNGTITSAGYNLDSDGSCGLSGTGDLSNMNPLLGPLANNGGPTQTHALLAGSPAIDAGNPATPGSGGNACEATDQRGYARPAGLACDIGAYEFGAPPPVGGIAEFAVDGSAQPASPGGGSGLSARLYAAVVSGAVAVVMALGAGGWYARRRWLR